MAIARESGVTVTTGTDASFYVVGGPLPPGHPSYVVREADRELCERLHRGEYCHVLAPRHSGRSSLMAQAAHRLRAEGIEVATLDLGDIGGRSVAEDLGRWYYSLAYRVVRELRLRPDLTAWWQERSGLTIRQRLRDFFLEIVLAGTRRPIVIMVDRVEAVVQQRGAGDAFDAVRACFDARATEPEYQRLAFALLGASGAATLLGRRRDSVFGVSAAVALRDFTPEELRVLGRGLPVPSQAAASATDRVWHWTGGQPYLSQKLCRALARRGAGALDDAVVDATAARQFLARGALREDPHLAWLAARLGGESPRRAARLTVYGRVRKGARVPVDATQPAQRELLDLGVLVEDDGVLTLRNRLYAEAFGPAWVTRNLPFSWRGVVAAAAALLVLGAFPVLYREYLPQPYLRALQDERQEFVVAQDAWRRLRRFPGFGAEADRLFGDYLARQSRASRRLPEVQRIGERLAALPGGAERARQLLAEFWDRRANLMAQRGDRDGAILYTLQALGEPVPERTGRLAELLGPGFDALVGTIRPEAPLAGLEVDPDNGLLTLLDERHEISVWRVDGAVMGREQRLALTAEEVRPLQRRRGFASARFGKRLTLTLRVAHARPQDLEVVLRAPSGREAMLRVADAIATGRSGEFRFDSRRHQGLLPLLARSAAGTWSASFSDLRRGVDGRLLGWDLGVDELVARGPAEAGVAGDPIPEPQPAAAMASVLGPGGRRALSWPVDPAARGDMLVWDVATGAVLARLPRPMELRAARFVLGHAAVLLVTGRDLELRDAANARVIGRLPVTAAGGIEPFIPAGGRFLGAVGVPLAESAGSGALAGAGEQRPLGIWDLGRLRRLGSIETGAGPGVAALDSGGTLIAVGDAERFVRVWRVSDQALVAECEHAGVPVAVAFDATGRWLASQDDTDVLRVWEIADGCRPVVTRRGNGPFDVAFSPDGLGLVTGNFSRGFEVLALPDGERIGPALQPGLSGAGSFPPVAASRPRFLPGSQRLVTYDGRKAVKVWALPWRADLHAAARAPGAERIVVDPGGTRVALGSSGGDVDILPLGPASSLRLRRDGSPSFIGHLSAVTSLAFDREARFLASGALDGTIRAWEVATGAPRSFIAAHGDGAVQDLVFLPDGNGLASASRASVLVLDVATGAIRARRPLQADRPTLAVVPDGRSILIAGDQRGLTRWDWPRGEARTLVGPEPQVRMAALSTDGQWLATAGADRVVRLWRPQAGSALRRSFTVSAPVDGLWFGADGSTLAVRTGAWLHLLSVADQGLAIRGTRPLPDADVVVAPGTGRDWLVLAGAGTVSPRIVYLAESRSWTAPWEPGRGPSPALIASRLSLAVGEAGELRPR